MVGYDQHGFSQWTDRIDGDTGAITGAYRLISIHCSVCGYFEATLRAGLSVRGSPRRKSSLRRSRPLSWAPKRKQNGNALRPSS